MRMNHCAGVVFVGTICLIFVASILAQTASSNPKEASMTAPATGSFVLQHTGIMTQNTPQLTITVVPDSGTGQLAGIAGKMTIIIAAGGKHSYDLEYSLPPSQ